MSDPSDPDREELFVRVRLGLLEARRRSETCLHPCGFSSVMLTLGSGKPLSARLKHCALAWFRAEYPPKGYLLRYESDAIDGAIPACPFCVAGKTSLVGIEDPEEVVSYAICMGCDAKGSIISGEGERALEAWGLRANTPTDRLSPEKRGLNPEENYSLDRPRGLRPCPFCGNVGLSVENGRTVTPSFAISCLTCDAVGPQSSDRLDAIFRWNLRST